MIETVQGYDLKPKPEDGIQFGAAGGGTTAEELEAAGELDVDWAVDQATQFIDAGAYMIMIESEGVSENVKSWRTDVPDEFAGPEVNLFVDHSQIVQLECLRRGIWGSADLWGRVQTYK